MEPERCYGERGQLYILKALNPGQIIHMEMARYRDFHVHFMHDSDGKVLELLCLRNESTENTEKKGGI